jgi:hypothetical protein
MISVLVLTPSPAAPDPAHALHVTDLGPTSFLLSSQIDRKRTKHMLHLSQRQYRLDLLHRFGFADCSPVSTLLDPSSCPKMFLCPQTPEDNRFMHNKPYTTILVEGPVEPDSVISGCPPANVSGPRSMIWRIKILQLINPQPRTTFSEGRVELQLSEAKDSHDTLLLTIIRLRAGKVLSYCYGILVYCSIMHIQRQLCSRAG